MAYLTYRQLRRIEGGTGTVSVGTLWRWRHWMFIRGRSHRIRDFYPAFLEVVGWALSGEKIPRAKVLKCKYFEYLKGLYPPYFFDSKPNYFIELFDERVELVKDIKQHGQLEPMVLSREGDRPVLLDGQHRLTILDTLSQEKALVRWEI